MDDIVENLRLNAEMMRDGWQKNLTKLWHSTVVKDAAKDCLEAADEITRLREIAEAITWHDIAEAPWSGPPVLLFRNGEVYVAARITGEHGPGWCTPDGFQIFNPTHYRLIGDLPEAPEEG